MKYVLFSLLLLCGCQKPPEHKQTLIVGTNPTYPPYESINSAGKCEGFDIDLAAALAKKLNKQLVIKELEFDSLILALKQGKVDCVMSGMSITHSRLQEIVMIPYQGEEVKTLALIFWNKIPEIPTHLTELGPIAVQVGTYQDGYLQSLKGVQVKPLEGNAEIILDLQYGKSAAAIFEPHIAKTLQKRFPQIQWVEIPLDEEYWVLGNGIGVKKENVTLIREIELSVHALKEEGVIQKLETDWMGS